MMMMINDVIKKLVNINEYLKLALILIVHIPDTQVKKK